MMDHKTVNKSEARAGQSGGCIRPIRPLRPFPALRDAKELRSRKSLISMIISDNSNLLFRQDEPARAKAEAGRQDEQDFSERKGVIAGVSS
jgi:hypothetical protein